MVDLNMLGMAVAHAAVREGEVREGIRLLDLAALAATTGELDDVVAVGCPAPRLRIDGQPVGWKDLVF